MEDVTHAADDAVQITKELEAVDDASDEMLGDGGGGATTTIPKPPPGH